MGHIVAEEPNALVASGQEVDAELDQPDPDSFGTRLGHAPASCTSARRAPRAASCARHNRGTAAPALAASGSSRTAAPPRPRSDPRRRERWSHAPSAYRRGRGAARASSASSPSSGGLAGGAGPRSGHGRVAAEECRALAAEADCSGGLGRDVRMVAGLDGVRTGRARPLVRRRGWAAVTWLHGAAWTSSTTSASGTPTSRPGPTLVEGLLQAGERDRAVGVDARVPGAGGCRKGQGPWSTGPAATGPGPARGRRRPRRVLRRVCTAAPRRRPRHLRAGPAP